MTKDEEEINTTKYFEKLPKQQNQNINAQLASEYKIIEKLESVFRSRIDKLDNAIICIIFPQQ